MDDVEKKERLADLLKLKKERIAKNLLKYYDPYPYQVRYHNDPSKRKGLRAGNQQGKTVAGCADDAFDLTGRYPDWYAGHRFDRPVRIVCGGINNDKTRDILQKALCGDPVDKENSLGTGWIPRDCLDPKKITLKRGVSDAYLHVKVKWFNAKGVHDGWSTLSFSSYESGKAAWMGDTIDIYHGDEEPPKEILDQMARGCIATGGYIRLTWTPENGSTDVVKTVAKEYSMHTAEWKDAAGEDFSIIIDGEHLEFKAITTQNGGTGHITRAIVEQACKDYSPRIMKMRMKGIPVVGVGLIFRQDEKDIAYDHISLPEHWRYLDAIDFGGLSSGAHPTAWARLVHDPETDIIRVYDGFKMQGREIPDIAARIVAKPNSKHIKTVYPHDGNKKQDKEGQTKTQYKKAGVNMFITHATNPPTENKGEGDGGIRREYGLEEMSRRFEHGTLLILKTLNEFFAEYQEYHYNDKGEIADEFDDFISAVRYGVMMIRHARPLTRGNSFLPKMAVMN